MSILDEIHGEVTDSIWHGHYLSMFCVFPQHHSDQRRRSLLCYEDYFKCLSCGAQGNPAYLLRIIGSGSTIIREEPVPFKNPWNSWLYDSTISEICRKAHKLVRNFPSQMSYWKSRGIPKKKILKLGLGWRDGWNTAAVTGRDGKVIGGWARASDSIDSQVKYVTPSRKFQENSKLLYVPGWKRLERSERVFLAFGVISAISLYLCGEAACAPLTGKKVAPEILQSIRKKIIIVPDHDEYSDAYKLADMLGWRGNVLELPYYNDVLDPNDLFLHDKNLLRKHLNSV